MSSYSEKLRDPRWQKKRLEILERDNFTCRRCGRKDQELHVHHLRYDRGCSPWEYDSDVLITLCKDDHSEVEQLKERIGRQLCGRADYIWKELCEVAESDPHQWSALAAAISFMIADHNMVDLVLRVSALLTERGSKDFQMGGVKALSDPEGMKRYLELCQRE